MEINFRLAAASDADRLIPMINQAFEVETFMGGTRTDAARLAEEMRQGLILMAEDDAGQLLGSIYYEPTPPRGYLGMLAVAVAHQGHGIGHKLVAAVEQRLRAAGCREAKIVVLSLRNELFPVYQHWGFVEAEHIAFDPGRPIREGFDCHGIVMVKPL
jgi:predicted N-acetyltransferase YhbS